MNLFRSADRAAWRGYLEEHFETGTEVWFVCPTKAAGEESLSYNDAVEEALCFGWIDSTNRRLDDLHRIQRFTPRRPGSPYSQPNIERLKWLDTQGMIHPKIRPTVEDLLTLKADPVVWEHYTAFSAPYKRIRVAYIDAARRRPAEFEKRLSNFISKTRENKLIVGFGGVDKYYK